MKFDRADMTGFPSAVDVFVCNDTVIDEDLFELWIRGHEVAAASKIVAPNANSSTFPDEETVLADVEDHYRTFAMLEPVLHSPHQLGQQLKFQIRPKTQKYLICKYYGLDDAVIREILGKKFSSRSRKDLDEVSAKTTIPIASCRRQFDNVKLVFKAVEEMPGCVKTNIMNEFLLPEPLARRYAAIVFMTFNRFETSKKRLASVGFERFAACSKAMMETWTDLDMDAEFFLDLRDLRVLQEREKDVRHGTIEAISATPCGAKASFRTECEAVFKSFSRGIITTATGLHRSKEVRDFFVTLLEKVIDPLKGMRWTIEQLNCFLTAYIAAGSKLDAMKKIGPSGLGTVWERYMSTMKLCILEFYSA